MLVTATAGTGGAAARRSRSTQDLQLSGAAAQYGRGMISDVTAVLMRDFAANMQNRIDALDRGDVAGQTSTPAPASGLAHRAPGRVDGAEAGGRRFFLPYQPNPS